MPKVKPHRATPMIDMTAMVDVAFLLLTFFILTTKFKAEEKVAVISPSSISDISIPLTDIMTTTIDENGVVFVGFAEQSTRKGIFDLIQEQLLRQDPTAVISSLGEKYFILQPQFGVPFEEFPRWLNQDVEGMKNYPQKGIPYPYVNEKTGRKDNQLKRLILFAMNVSKRQKVGIKADKETPVPAVQDVISTFQDWNLNKFYLITDLEAAPMDMIVHESSGK